MPANDRPTLRSAFPRATHLTVFGPHAAAHHPALRLLLSAFVPCAVLFAIDRVDLLPAALMASVVAVYGRRASARRRLAMQAEFALLQVFFIVTGAAVAKTDPSPLTAVLLITVAAGLATVVADRRGWMPPGALFPTFAFAVLVSAPPTSGGVALIAVTAAGAAVVALAVTFIWSIRGVVRGNAQDEVPEGPRLSVPLRVTRVHAAVCVVGGALAGIVAVSLGLTHPYWAIVSAIVPVFGLSTQAQFVRAGHRLFGTILGIASSAILFLFPYSEVGLMILLLLLMVGTELFIARNYAVALFFVTPMTVGFAMLGGSELLPELLGARLLETALGLGVAVVLIACTHAVRHPRAEARGTR